MTRKTLISLFLGAVMLCGTASGMTVTLNDDMSTNQLTITNSDSDDPKVQSGDKVTAMILKPGAREDSPNADDIVYTWSQRAVKDAYSFDVTMPADAEGLYTFIVTYTNDDGSRYNKVTTQQNFYSYDKKKTMAAKLDSGNFTADDIKTAMNTFSLENYEPYTAMNSATRDATIETKMKNVVTEYHNNNTSFAEDPSKANELLKFAVTAAALEEDCACMTNTDGSVKEDYAEILGFKENTLYSEYPNSLTANGIAAVKKALQDAKVVSKSKADTAFENAMLLNLITNYKSDGSGHVGQLLDTYSTEYKKAGMDPAARNGVQNLTNLYDSLKNSTATTIYALANEYKNLVANTGGGGGTAGGGTAGGGTRPSGGTGGAGGVAGGGIGNVDYSSPSAIETFSDLDSVPWAAEAIKILADKGVIAGKGNNLFAPNDNVTRQEFVKMLVGTFGFSVEDTTCYFADVTADWAKPYVAIANALGIVNGTSATTFSPDALITREDGAVMLARAAAVLGNALEPGGNTFADDAQIAAYAKDGVYGLANAGIISGKGNNNFDPKASMTRAEAAKMIYGLSIR